MWLRLARDRGFVLKRYQYMCATETHPCLNKPLLNVGYCCFLAYPATHGLSKISVNDCLDQGTALGRVGTITTTSDQGSEISTVLGHCVLLFPVCTKVAETWALRKTQWGA